MIFGYILLIIYILICFISFSKTKLSIDLSKKLYLGLGIMLVLIITFRPSYMPDYEGYASKYYSPSLLIREVEPAYYLIVTISRFLFGNHLLMFFIYGVIAVCITMLSIKKQEKVLGTICLPIIVWLSYMFIYQDMIQIRQAVASALFLFSLQYIQNKDYKRYFLINTLGVLFHYTALITFPIYLLSTTKQYKVFYISLIPISYLIYYSGLGIVNFLAYIDIDFVRDAYMHKATSLINTGDVALINKRQIIQITLCLLMWLNSNKIVAHTPEALIWLKIYTIAISIFIVLFDIPDFASRLNVILMIVEIFCLPVAFMSMKRKTLGQVLLIGVEIIFFYNYYNSFVLGRTI